MVVTIVSCPNYLCPPQFIKIVFCVLGKKFTRFSFQSTIQLKLIPVYGVRQGLSFTFLHKDIKFIQHYLLKTIFPSSNYFGTYISYLSLFNRLFQSLGTQKLFFFLWLLGLQDLSSLTRDQTCAPVALEAQSPNTGPLGNSLFQFFFSSSCGLQQL